MSDLSAYMSALSIDKVTALCGHDRFTIGCPACQLDDCAMATAYANEQAIKAKDEVKQAAASVKDAKKDEVRDAAVKVQQAAQEKERGWLARAAKYDADVKEMEGKVKQILKSGATEFEPLEPGQNWADEHDVTSEDDRQKAFRGAADETEDNLLALWKSAYPPEKEDEVVELPSFDPMRTGGKQQEVVVRDCARIEGTGDFAIRHAKGMQAAATMGKADWHPSAAAGTTPATTFMSYGAALKAFGYPVPPGESKKQEGAASHQTELSWRLKNVDNYVSDVDADLLRKYPTDLALLGCEYMARLREHQDEEKARKERAANSGRQSESSNAVVSDNATTSVPTASTTATAPVGPTWPPLVTSDSLGGFTDWITAMKKKEKKFNSGILNPWHRAKHDRFKTGAKAIEEWTKEESVRVKEPELPTPGRRRAERTLDSLLPAPSAQYSLDGASITLQDKRQNGLIKDDKKASKK